MTPKKVKTPKAPIETAAKSANTVGDLLRADSAIDVVNRFTGSALTDIRFVLIISIDKGGDVTYGYGGEASPLELEGLGLRMGDAIGRIIESL